MPRGPRIAFENAFFHVYNRGVAKQKIFLEDSDYRYFLKRVLALKTKKLYDHEIYAYVLMPNHFHILIQTKKTPIAKVMTSLLTSYSMYFNKKYKRVGTLFQNRFKSKLCDKDSYFLGASRYIHLNPLEAGITDTLESYKWSSYQELYGSLDLNILSLESIDRLVGKNIKEKEAYAKFLEDGISNINVLIQDYRFDREVEGQPKFNTLSQKKYLRRKNKNMKQFITTLN